MIRTRLKIVGQSGSGLLTAGELVADSLKELGYEICTDREYPSLIKGGTSCFTINFSDQPVRSLSKTADILVAIDKPCLLEYFPTLKKEGILVHGYERLAGIKEILDQAKQKKIKVVACQAREIAEQSGGTVLMANIILTGLVWGVLGLDLKIMQNIVEKKFAKKFWLPIAIKCLQAGFASVDKKESLVLPKPKPQPRIMLDGNHALSLGAIHGGMRAYIAYPMSPASSILTHVAQMAKDTGVLVKQAEDEITAAQMVVGASFAGTRSMTATSGGGYDLMTETVSLAGIIENPLVIVCVQRPGPATGLPTWTGQGDLNMVTYSAHGEFARIVLSVSDPTDAFDLIQHAFNLSEKYQTPVVVLSEKVIAESQMTIPNFDLKKIKIERGLVTGKDLDKLESSDRYKITKNGISLRWLPGSSGPHYFANGDEHDEEGRIDETEEAGDMYAKRMRKVDTIKKELPEPEVFGSKKAKISFIGWGSSKGVMLDTIANNKDVNYLHVTYLHPLRTEKIKKFMQENKNVHLIEGNYEGQLGNKIEGETGQKFKGKLLKWNGRQFFTEDVEEYIKKSN
ncbi:2-oxoacid:acceptor oxidoreductase subunit alpha [Candidatus Gracilibacteria bacterium]|nr:2-oxoacid:acceptor oxidoreductase subunit alpha [Candidatus Gracilibacteria bacterium]